MCNAVKYAQFYAQLAFNLKFFQAKVKEAVKIMCVSHLPLHNYKSF